jgi:hypothetical protein
MVYGLSNLILECFSWAGGGNLEVVFIYKISYFSFILLYRDQSEWPRGIRRRSTAARPLRLWVRIPPGAWMFICCECCILSGRGLCDGLITRPEESY